jgi:hypothetical protein
MEPTVALVAITRRDLGNHDLVEDRPITNAEDGPLARCRIKKRDLTIEKPAIIETSEGST